MRTVTLLKSLLGFALFALPVAARFPQSYTDAELQQNSDLVVIARPVSVKVLAETNSLGYGSTATFKSRFRGIETTFKISKVLKGESKASRIILHHYRTEPDWGDPPNGPSFVTFLPDTINEYLLYLKNDGSNRYAPTTGQIDPYNSVRSPSTGSPIANLFPLPTFTSNGSDKLSLHLISADSEETTAENGNARNALDGDPATYWHTQWQSTNPVAPHEIIIELIPPTAIKGVTYLPRQDPSDHGQIKDYELYVSEKSTNFTQPVSHGTFTPGKDKKVISLEPMKCRYLKLKALTEINHLP